jgi:hypothetical protein
MFQNLQTWHIIAIVLGIFAVVAIAVYIMKGDKNGEKKDDKNADKKGEEKGEFKFLPKMLAAVSGNRLMASTSESTSVSVNQSFERTSEELYKSLGMALCNKPIQYENLKDFMKNMENKIKGNSKENLIFYIVTSDKLTLDQKKDFICAIVIQIEQIQNRNRGGSHSLKLIEDGKIECKGMFPFCNDKNIFTIKEFGDELYELVTSIFDKNKYIIMRRNILKVRGTESHEMLDNGVVKITKKQYTEEEINSAIERAEKEWEEKISKLKNEMAANPFCTLY